MSPLIEAYDVSKTKLMFGTDAVLVRAKSLAVSHERVKVQRAVAPVSYIQISLRRLQESYPTVLS